MTQRIFLIALISLAICTVVAAQSSFTLTLKTEGSGNGSVFAKAQDGTQLLACALQPAAVCSRSLPAGTVITINTVPSASNGSTFDGWQAATGAASSCVGTNPCTFTLNSDASVFAFINSPAKLTLSVTGPGRVSFPFNGSTVTCDSGHTLAEGFFVNAQVTLTAIPASGAVFDSWTLVSGTPNGAMCNLTASPCSFSIKTPIFVKGNFKTAPTPPPPPPPTQFVVRVTKSGSGTGTVVDNHGLINCGSTCSASFQSGAIIAISSRPAANSTFRGWINGTGNTVSCNNTTKLCGFTVSQNSSITAVFDLIP